MGHGQNYLNNGEVVHARFHTDQMRSECMKVQEIGKRGFLFTFFELDNCPTNVFVINGKDHLFICDTFLGPDSMEEMKSHVRSFSEEKPFVVFNSHSHWDHIWGNCAFPSSVIISHTLCRETIMKEAESELQQYEEYKMGNVKIVLPTLTFTQSVFFPDEDVTFFHTPGHTKDSASCLDHVDNTLFVGDNIEEPIPYLFSDALGLYVHTLKEYLRIDATTVIPGHGTIPDESIITENVDYVEAFMRNDTEKYEKGKYQFLHQMNLKIQRENKK